MGEIYRQSLTEIHRQRMHDVDQLISFRKTDTRLYSDLLKDVEMLRRFEFEAKRRLNSCTPFLRLPPEVITLIAHILVDEWMPVVLHCSGLYGRERPSIGWLALTHICHTLRSALLGDCSLWASMVQIFSGEAQSVILSRARTFPLVLRVNERQCFHTAEQVRFMMNNLFQAREISVCDRPLRSAPTMVNRWPLGPAALAGQELPHLTRLELILTPNSNEDLHWMLVSGDAFELEPMIAPRLESLSLRNFYVPFDASSLTFLKLDNVVDLALPTPTQFLSILRSCDRLQTLDLTAWIPRLLPADEPTVSLPSLKAIIILDKATQTLAFFSHIIIPPSAFVSLTLSGMPHGVDPNSTEGYLDAIQHRVRPKIPLPIHTASIAFDGATLKLALLYSPSEPPQTLDRGIERHTPYCTQLFLIPSLLHPEPQHLVTLAVAGLLPSSVILLSNDVFGRTIDHYSLATNLRMLDIKLPTGTSFPYDAWCALLTPLTYLHTLRVPRLSLKNLLPMLVVPSTSSLPSLPALRNLLIETLDLRPQSGHSAPVEPSRRIATLCDMLLSRRAAGVGLERLRVDMLLCSTDEIARGVILPRLRALVPRVEWAGDGSICEDEE